MKNLRRQDLINQWNILVKHYRAVTSSPTFKGLVRLAGSLLKMVLSILIKKLIDIIFNMFVR